MQVASNLRRGLYFPKGGSSCSGNASAVRTRRGTRFEAQGQRMSSGRESSPPDLALEQIT